jgi:CHAT domain-containing protein
MGSYSQRFAYRCPNGHEGSLLVWLVVDGEERPDLLRRVGEGEFTPPRCRECSAEAGVRGQLSLLVRRPGKRPEMLFGSATLRDRDRVREQAQLSMMMLNRGRAQPVGGDAIVVPYELLAVMAPRDMDADANALEAGSFTALSSGLQRYRDWLRDYAAERFEQATKSVLLSLLQADSPGPLLKIIAANPILLDRRVDTLLGHIAEAAEQEGQPQMAYIARVRRDLLRRAREEGVDQAFGPDTPPPQVHAAGPADGEAGESAEAPRPDSAGEATLTPAVGAALVAMAGYPIGDRTESLSGQELRQLLERALADMSPDEAELAMKYLHGEHVGLRDLMMLWLATELLSAPRDRNDQLEAQRLLHRLGHMRETAPHTWANAEHNAAVAATALAAPGDLAALDAARAGYERALTVRTREANPDEWAETTSALADLLRDAYPSQEPRYVDRSIKMLDDALADPPPDLSPAAHLRLSLSRASSVLRQAELRGDAEALRRAADSFATVLAEARRDGVAQAVQVALTNLGMALSLRAERTGQPADWRQAIDVLREALDKSSGGTPLQWVSAAINLSIALRHAGDIEAAIPLMRETLERAEAGGFWTAWASTQNNLGNALLDRVGGDRDENVDQAISAYDSARRIWTREAFPVEWALTTARLAVAYEVTLGGRDRAAALLREAAELVPRDERPVDWARLTNRLASYEPLASAITRYRAAAEVLTRTAFPHEWASIQNNLGNLYKEIANKAPGGDDAAAYLAAAIDCYSSALDARPAGEDPLQWAETATSLGDALSRRGQRADAVSVLRQALEVMRTGAPAARVVLAASRLGVILAEDGRWPDAAGALQEAIDAADRIYATSLLRRSREETISENSWLSPALAYCLARQGRPADAVDALEHGRTRLLADALARDPERVTLARTSHPEEYEAYVAAVRRLAAADAASTRLTVADLAEAGTAYHRQAEQAVRDELREASAAFERASSRLPELPAAPREQAAGNVTVYLFSTGLDSTALLVWPDAVESLRLPDVHDSLLRRFVHGDDQHLGLLRAQNESRHRLRAELADCLGVLGPHAMRPVADTVRASGARSVTLVPVGLFSAIPLHAAPVDADGRCLLDDVPVTYAPSGAVLAEARRSARHRGGKKRSGLAIVDPTAGLAFTAYEVDAMVRWTGGRRVDSTTLDVVDELAGATHIHFACHGRSLVDKPLESHLALGRGHRLTLLDLLTSERPDLLREAQLVVASACQTATVDTTRTPDEFVGLAAGFLAAGVPCFLGTLWPSDDVPSALVMSRFYELLIGEGLAADEALRRAQRWLRDLDGRSLAEHLESRPGLAAVRPGLASLAASQPDQQFYADPVSWSPYVVIGAVELSARPGGVADERTHW